MESATAQPNVTTEYRPVSTTAYPPIIEDVIEEINIASQKFALILIRHITVFFVIFIQKQSIVLSTKPTVICKSELQTLPKDQHHQKAGSPS